MSLPMVASRAAQRVRDDLADPLFRNAYALMLATAATSGLGIVYWVAAARLYSEREVGQASAIVAAMLMLSNVAQLNLSSGLIRFLPRSGPSAFRLVRAAYLGSAAAAVVLAAGLLLVANRLSTHLQFLTSSSWIAVGFVVGTATWCVFSLQDAALTGLRRTPWVPVENAAFGLVKVLLLLGFAGVLPHGGVLLSWLVPMVVALVPVNVFLFGRAIPAERAAYRPAVGTDPAGTVEAAPHSMREIARFVSIDYVGTLFGHACTTALPLIVVAVAGAEANAHFYMAWTVATALDLIAVNTAISLTVEGAHDRDALARRRRDALRRCLRLLLPAVAVVVLLAPTLLHAFGSGYADASTVLRLLALAVVPRAVVLIYLASLRVERRLGAVVAAQAGTCVLMLAGTFLLLPVLSVTGVGVAWLVTQLAVAAVAGPAMRWQTNQ
jgi:O-antigen/teichoic acid export membrane protein